MQTGPAPKQSMDQWLLWTGLLEIANIAIFGFLWSILSRRIPGEARIFSVLGLITLSVILLEGGLYWLMVRARFFQRAPVKSRLRLLQGVYGFNILLMLGFPALLIVRVAAGLPMDWTDLLLGGAYYIFALGEFVHYFVFKINMRPYEWQQALQTGRFVPARLLREMQRARGRQM